MRIRHAAALALAGWYLMVAPPDYQPFGTKQEPISRWALIGGFDSADRCDQAKMEWYRTVTKGKDEKEKGRLAFASACVATDDPRLKP